jgi:NADPH:quinone reductase-like Zn-dependent oxidoreductase
MAASGLRRPGGQRRVGCDYAGTIEGLGLSVTGFTVGEPVFGIGDGSLVEYLAAPADRVVRKPERVTFEEAAAVPFADSRRYRRCATRRRFGPVTTS